MADDEAIRGLRAQLIGTCHESGFQGGWLKPAFHCLLLLKPILERRQGGRGGAPGGAFLFVHTS